MALAPEQSRVSLMGLDFDALTETEAVATILDSLEEGQGGWVVTPNLEYLRAYSSPTTFSGSSTALTWSCPTACRSCGRAG